MVCIQIDRKNTGREETYRQAEGEVDRQKDWKKESKIERQRDENDRQIDKYIDRWIDSHIDKRTGRKKDRQTEIETDRKNKVGKQTPNNQQTKLSIDRQNIQIGQAYHKK